MSDSRVMHTIVNHEGLTPLGLVQSRGHWQSGDVRAVLEAGALERRAIATRR